MGHQSVHSGRRSNSYQYAATDQATSDANTRCGARRSGHSDGYGYPFGNGYLDAHANADHHRYQR